MHNLFGLSYTSKQPPHYRYPRSPNPKLHPPPEPIRRQQNQYNTHSKSPIRPKIYSNKRYSIANPTSSLAESYTSTTKPKSRYPRSNAIVYAITQSEWLSGQLSRNSQKLKPKPSEKYVSIDSTNQPKTNSGGAQSHTMPIPDPDSYPSILDSGSQAAGQVPFQSLNSIPPPLMREILESILDLNPETQITMPDLKQTLDTLATIVEDSNHDPNFVSTSLSNSIKQLKTNITPNLRPPANNISIIPGIMLETNNQQNNKFNNSKPKTQQEHKITYSSVIQPVVIQNSSIFNTQDDQQFNSSNILDSDKSIIIKNSENSYDIHNPSPPAQASTNLPPSTIQNESKQNYPNLDHHPGNQNMIVQDNPKPPTSKFPSFAVSCSKSETTNNFICRPKSSFKTRGYTRVSI